MVGDHIRAMKGGRWQHAIDLGDQRVIHFAEDPRLPPGERVRRAYRPDFTAGATAVEVVVHRERAYPPRAVVARAWSRLADPSLAAAFSDSEAFATWCKVGRLPSLAAPGAPSAAAKAAPAPKPTAARPAAKKALVKKAAVKKAPARKATGKKASAKKGAKRPAAKKGPARKAAARKAPARKAVARRPAPKAKARRKSRR